MNTYFNNGYKKFENFVEEKELIPRNRDRVIIAYSGGKDASVLCGFFCEYKKKVRPDLNIEIVTVNFPNFLYNIQPSDQYSLYQTAINFWEKIGVKHTLLNVFDEYDSEGILDFESPCKICSYVKTITLGNYIRKTSNSNSVFCLGLNLDDSIGWFIEIMLLLSNKGNAEYLKKNKPDLYHELLVLSIRIIHRLYSKKYDVLFTRPIINFTNQEIENIAIASNFPLIPENCREITKRATFYDSPRRDFAHALLSIRKKYDIDDTIYNNYDEAYKYYMQCKFIPSQEELNIFMDDNSMV